ncbi:Zinc finger CCCH domain-containing protein 10 [Danaus plexippus plexippus]|uniref:Zinc finger CCCH domain-containing protein 10 n=1 Tax=Danaus plexippus plexippus TaxID=278856 RepID=A0A212EQF6_DANPL|nr:Zinc finger CCCH domain-containing protein 10 [Danaus plexippus plexippus]
MDHIEVTNRTAPDPPPPPNVQPPLPLDPPPLDEKYSLQVKQEIDDSKYENSTSEEVPEIQNRETVNGTNSTQEPTEKSKVPICRDFIRGSCKRPGTCRYAHKYDLSQLVGVYTFCRDYQTSVCTYPICKYVHATVFEEQHFYRTGVLPPHALAHHNKVNVNVVQPPPPPPPPPPQPQPQVTDVQNNFSHVPMRTPMIFTVPPPNLQNELQYHKDVVEKMELARDEKIENTCLLERKKKKINALILTLFKLSSKNQNHSSDKETNHGGDKDKMLLEQLSSILSVNGRMSTLGEDE